MSAIANWFISTKTSGPVNGQVQDSVVGSFALTRADVRVGKYHAMALFAGAGAEPPRFDARPPGAAYTGGELASLVFAATPVDYRRPPTFYSDVYAPYLAFDPAETLTVVERGRLARGVLDKRAIGAKQAGGLFHLVGREYGSQRALDAVFALQQVALQFLLFRGFTVGVADMLVGAAAAAAIRGLVSAALLDSREVTASLLRGEVLPPIGATARAHYERLQRAALRVDEGALLRQVLGSIRPATNGLFLMIATGTKGGNPNLLAITGAIGQTVINEERIREQFAFRRTHPYFPRFATAAEAYGFVANSYVAGMRSPEFIFQGMHGRFDLINKALSTASTGYFARKGVMNLQSALVDNRRRVAKDGRVVQYLYGEDGLDARGLERVEYRTAGLDDAALAAFAGVDLAAAAGSDAERRDAGLAVDAALAALRADRDALRAALGRLEASGFGASDFERGDAGPRVALLGPVNVRRLVDAARPAAAPLLAAAGLGRRVARVADLAGRLVYALLNEVQERRRAPPPPALAAAASLVAALVRAELCPAVLAGLDDAALAYVEEAVRLRYALALVDYGTAAGILAAQAVSEPLTQYMLDSHHRSVGGGTNKAGITRIAEIYGARGVEAEDSSGMLLPLRPAALGRDGRTLGAERLAAAAPDAAEAARVAEAARAAANAIESVTLRRFVRRHDTLLEPPGGLRYPPFAGDAAWVAEFERAHPLVRPPADLTNWCYRFALDKRELVLKDVSLELLVRRLRGNHPGLYVVHTPEGVPEPAVRAWARATLFRRGGDDEARAAELERELLATPVRGVRGLARATAERVVRHRPGPGGALLREERWVVMASGAEKGSGTNLYGALLNSAVDPTCAISTSVADTCRVLGIEAARAKIVSETRTVLQDGTPNLRHLFLYADEMCRLGKISSIERGGLAQREPTNVLLKMAYGAPIQAVTDAALAGARSHVYGVAGEQLLGSLPHVGTTWNSAVVDEAFVSANMVSVDSVLDAL